jgi:prolipoprotein diacylglyceryl transferase
MSWWNNIYTDFNPVAFSIFGFSVHWYGLMYVLALITALLVAKFIVKHDKISISNSLLDNYFFWVEIGVIFGARLGYILIYDSNTIYYLTHPWQIFNPFYNGEFVGIRGMSYHGAVIGFLLATWAFCKKFKKNIWILLDLCAVSIPLGYFFGRIGNFLNQELFGRVTDMTWAINVAGQLRHPSQLYEAVLEGLVVFAILFVYRKFKRFDGELICFYAMLYTLARFICEYFREPDFGIGFVFLNLSMGQILSILMFVCAIIVFIILNKKYKLNFKNY